MAPNHLIADIATARRQDLHVEAQRQHRIGRTSPSRSLHAVVGATARRISLAWAIHSVPEGAAA